jgi:hypothetical protein
MVTLGFDARHIFLLKELRLSPFVRYLILIVVDVINGNVVVGAGRGLVWTQNCVSCLWVHTVRLPRHANSELRHVSSLTVREETTIEVGFFVLTGASAILKCLESLIEFLSTNTAHLSFLLENFAF